MKMQTLAWLCPAQCMQVLRLLVKRRGIWEGVQPQTMTLKRYRQQYSETSKNIPWRSKEGQVQPGHRVSPGGRAEGLEAATGPPLPQERGRKLR